MVFVFSVEKLKCQKRRKMEVGYRRTAVSSSFLQKPHREDLRVLEGFSGGSVVKNPPANSGDMGLIPELERSPGEGNGNPMQQSCLGDPMNSGAWQATVHRVTNSQIQFSDSTCYNKKGYLALAKLILVWKKHSSVLSERSRR